MILLGAAGQFGIFGVLILALLLGFSREEAASIGIIGAIDGPTSIYGERHPGPAPPGADHGRRLQLHGPRAGHHAAGHAGADHACRAADPDAGTAGGP